ncbi:MAG TPA: DEAD/DEAH box helicase [Planctomycetaceae bacterium]|nr:DEAD/DEAH box helicase [Planctomycetaceae bacterium]
MDSVALQFSELERVASLQSVSHDWNYLVMCASVLAQAGNPECEDAALRIAQHCLLQSGEANLCDASCVILDTLTNKPTIRLAESRNLIEPNPMSRLPLPLRAAWLRRELEQLVVLGDGHELSLNRFQKIVWQAATKTQVLSISAPTSTGKSFLLCQWLAEYFRDNSKAFVVYVVPTRALIQQVENDLRNEFAESQSVLPSINVSSLPMVGSVKDDTANVMVLTQERLHILLLSLPFDRRPSLMIVDEAHKFGDGARGILLNNVIDTVATQTEAMKLFFASPLVSNPQILLRGRSAKGGMVAVSSSHITVNQNLLWVCQVKRKPTKWTVEVCVADRMENLGEITLPFRPTSTSKRLTLVANALAAPNGGNLVYADGAADAEKAAHQLWDLRKPPEGASTELQGLIDLIKRYIHPKYALANTLSRGVAFHYGNMPLLIRTEIERLFKDGYIHFLVCTSTLVEGVNLPCKSIFIRGPHKGRGKPMNETDFWNLAGRAGRLGKEFQGNVICVDARNTNVWKVPPPTKRSTYPIKPAVDSVFDDFEEFVTYINDGTPVDVGMKRPDYDQLVSYLIAQFKSVDGLSQSPACSYLSIDQRIRLEDSIGTALDSVTLPLEIVNRNPGISPLAMQSLLVYFQARKKTVEELLPVLPESEDSVQIFNNIFSRINSHLAPVFAPASRTFALAILVVDWMRGLPLSRIIGSRISYFEKKKRDYNLASTIRSVMDDVEQVARFAAPRYLSCYIDILKYHLQQIERLDLVDEVPDVNIWLEFGASQQTQLSMMGLGLSRTTAIALSEFILDDNLSEDAVIQRIALLSIESLGLPLAIQREVQTLVQKKFS